MMLNTKYEKASQNRYQEIVEELAKLSDWELQSYCLSDSDKLVIQAVLDYKHKTTSTNLDLQTKREILATI